MAIYPKVNGSVQGNTEENSTPQPINIEAWTEQATQSLNAVSLVSPSGVRGTSVSLAIDLDPHSGLKPDARANDTPSVSRPRREPLRRDSLKRREALLKGKEGSRRRTRWENGSYHKQLLHLPSFSLTMLVFRRSSLEQPMGAASTANRLGSTTYIPQTCSSILSCANVGSRYGCPRWC